MATYETVGRPVGILEISYAAPGGTPTWEDESEYLIRFSTDRGKQNELDRQDAGTATFLLINRDGRFDPMNASGAHYPNVLPMRRVRLRTELPTEVPPFTLRSSHLRDSDGDTLRAGTVSIDLYSGFVESWHQTWAQGNGDAAVIVRCVDAFKVFNLFEFMWAVYYQGSDTFICGFPGVANVTPAIGPPLIPGDRTGTRINRVLDCIGWPAEDRSIDLGTVTIWGHDGSTNSNIPVTANSLVHLNDVAATEGGYLFIDKSGRVRFIDTEHIPTLSPGYVYGGSTGEIHFADIEGPYDDARLWNDITVTPVRTDLMSTATAEDATSIAQFYRREYSITLLTISFAELEARADALLARYKDPKLRFERLDLIPGDTDELRQVLTKELADVVLVRKRPATADVIARELRIEGINIEAPGGTDWRVTWQLSDVAVGDPGEDEFGPASISDLRLWLKADSLVLSDNDPVATWADSSGGGFDFTQATGGKQPLYKTSIINGKPVVRFDGTDDLLVRAAIDISSAVQGSLFLVLSRASSGAELYAFASSDEASTTRYVRMGKGTTDAVRVVQATADTADTIGATNTLTINTFYIAEFTSTDTAYEIRLNGTAETLIVHAGANTGDWFAAATARDNFTVGALKRTTEGLFWGGDIAEVILYDHAVTTDERDAVEAYLSVKYGITVS